MRIFNQDKKIELHKSELDLSKGYLKADKVFIKHHDAVLPVDEQGHYETIKEYPSGGKDVAWVVDIPAVEAKDAYDEYEDIQVYVPYTEVELKNHADKELIKELKAELAKIKEDIEQETFGLVRGDYAEKKARAAEIINKLRVLEGKEPREVKTVEGAQ